MFMRDRIGRRGGGVILYVKQSIQLIQESFLTQHVLEQTRGENLLDIVLSSQKELVDNVKNT